MTSEALRAFIQDSIKIDDNGCWIWQKSLSRGYGQTQRTYKGKKYGRAHRLSYAVYKGEMPEGLVTDHLCRVTSCVNPEHLEAVTTWVNTIERGRGPTAVHARKTHCKRGHPLTPDNVYQSLVKNKKFRHCITCDHDRNKAWRLKNRVRVA